MAIDTTTVLIILCGIILITLGLVIHLIIRINRLTRGKDAKSLESVILHNTTDIEKLKQFKKELKTYLTTVESRLTQSIRGVSTVRFNPFKGTGDGGSQSFATALLDGEKDGVVISTINTRERMSIFAKPIKKGVSEYELTTEEKKAVQLAQEHLNK